MDAVERLDEGDRLVVVLHYLQGLSLRELSQVLDQPLGTIKWRVHAALKRLRGLLERGRANEHHLQAAGPAVPPGPGAGPGPAAEATGS